MSRKLADIITVLCAIPKAVFLIIIGFIALVKSCVTDDPDPMDHSINKTQRIVDLVPVVDSTGNGFRVHYATAFPVTNERYDEIFSRRSLKEAKHRLCRDAPEHFGGSLLETDIYDFARFAREYDVCSDVHIDCIFVYGTEKTAMYARPNPNLPDGQTWINVYTEQGIQWLKHDDIYYRNDDSSRVYRYWKCPGMREISFTDERFTHFTEDEAIH